MYRYQPRGGATGSPAVRARIHWTAAFFLMGGVALAARFFQLQVLEAQAYRVLATDQHEAQSSLTARRGTIYLEDRVDKTLYPIAKDRDAWTTYLIPREAPDLEHSVSRVAELLGVPADEIRAKIKSPTSTYAVVQKDTPLKIADTIRSERIPGVGVSRVPARLYPEEGIGGHVIGFVSLNEKNERVGRYGVEAAMQQELAGKNGTLVAERDAAGGRLVIGAVRVQAAVDGADMILTLDRTIQHRACEKAQDAVRRFEADSASIVILDAKSGAVIAMCSSPNFEPAQYQKVPSIATLNNPATFEQFEPGSIFKPVTLAAGLDAQKITPRSTYVDRGEETMDGFTVRNSDKLAHGLQTMTSVLEKSLNTGTIYVERLLGTAVFREYVKKFGFGDKTGIELPAEAKGNILSLERGGKIFGATASYGQGISVTTLQMAAAFAALGNGGRLYQPFIIKEIRYPDGRVRKTSPRIVRDAILPQTSRLISGMLVSVVEHGHGHRAGVPGYYVAGKTGTAQVPDPHGQGYLKNVSIGSFAGYAPAEDPAFAMVVRINHPRTVEFAESSAAPIFGEMAAFLLNYLQIPPER